MVPLAHPELMCHIDVTFLQIDGTADETRHVNFCSPNRLRSGSHESNPGKERVDG